MASKFIYIYDSMGYIIDVFSVPLEYTWVEGRFGEASNGVYYKGIGNKYSFHYSFNTPFQSKAMDAGYLSNGNRVTNIHLLNKFGIFTIPFSPVFSEYVGGCGSREVNIIKNSKEFDYSDIEILDKFDISCINHSVYSMRCKSNRRKFIHEPSVKKLMVLLDYLMSSGWNMPWNKNSVADITPSGTITDVADLFRSDLFLHKVGTIYSIVSSLYRSNFPAYQELKKEVKHKIAFSDFGVMSSIIHGVTDDCILLSITILATKYDISVELPLTRKCIKDFVLAYIVSGRNYAYGEKSVWGDIIRQSFINRILEGQLE